MVRLVANLLFLVVLVSQSCNSQNKKLNEQEQRLLNSFNSKDYRATIKVADSLIANDPNNPNINLVWELKSRALFNRGRLNRSIDAMNKAISIDSNSSRHYFYRSLIFSQMGQFEKALTDINEAIRLKPDSVLYKKKRGQFEFQLGNYSSAIEDLETYRQSNDRDYSTILTIASAYQKLKKYDKALEYLKIAENIDSIDYGVMEQRGFIYLGKENYEKAIEYFSNVIANPTISGTEKVNNQAIKAYGYNNRGFAYYKAGKNEKALKDINQSLQLLPSNSYAYKNRALVYLDNGKTKLACKDLRKASKLGYSKKYDKDVEILLRNNCK